MSALDIFKNNLVEVDRLIHFDKEILELVTQTIQDLHTQLKQKFADERLNGGRALQTIQGIRKNASVQSKYQAIYNQAIVLLVSHFSSTLGDLFRSAVTEHLLDSPPTELLKEDFKITIADIREKDWSLKNVIPDLLIAKHDLTFQDMQSTVRAFKTYAGLQIQRDVEMNNIIASQACRHVIVHAGGNVSERMLKQLSSVKPRQLKPELRLGEHLNFSVAEVELVKHSMLLFVERLASSNLSDNKK